MSCGQPTSGLRFQFEFHITVLCYMGRVSVKPFVTNCNIKNMRFFLCTVYLRGGTVVETKVTLKVVRRDFVVIVVVVVLTSQRKYIRLGTVLEL